MGKYSGEKKLSLPMIESLATAGECGAWIDKINIRAKKLIEIHDENGTKAAATDDLGELSELMKDDKITLQEIEFLKAAKLSIQARNDSLIKQEEETIRSYQFTKVDW
jgi:hypothetical protein